MTNVKRCALVAAILGSGIVFLDGTIVNVALPAIRSSLHGALSDQQWIVEAYLLLLRRLPSDSRTPGHVDIIGAILCALGLGGPVFALIEQPQYGWGSPRVAVPLIAGLVLLAAFIAWERRSPQPMMPLNLFTVRN